MANQELAIPASPKLRSVASVGWFGVMAVVWLAMVALAIVMLVVMMFSDLVSALRGALHLGPAPSSQRASYRIANIF